MGKMTRDKLICIYRERQERNILEKVEKSSGMSTHSVHPRFGGELYGNCKTGRDGV